MKLVSFGQAGSERAGVLVDDAIIDLTVADETLPATLSGILAAGALDHVAHIAETAPPDAMVKSVRLGPPVTDPSKIICLGRNYKAHASEQNKTASEFPLLFSKGPNTLCGSGDVVPYPAGVEQFDFEVELAFVIGKRGKSVARADVWSHVAGFMIFIDLTARDLQARDGQYFRAKSVDNGGPCGPYLVTADEIENPHDLAITLTLNGETMQSSRTSEMTFRIDYLVHYISQTMTLEPGDIIATGTPSGVGAHRLPPRFLQHGDRIDATIDNLGTLACTIG